MKGGILRGMPLFHEEMERAVYAEAGRGQATDRQGDP